MSEEKAIAVRPAAGGQLVTADALATTAEQLNAVRKFVASQLKAGLDFGAIPGAGTKNVLLLPGAQKVAMLFNASPVYDIVATELGNGHVEFQVKTTLVHRGTGTVIGSGVGSCSTMESKYRFRSASRVCPNCGKPAIVKGKAEYGGGWLCFTKKDGCGAKWPDGAPEIESQATGKVENENIADARNTVLKMAKKRSMVDAATGLGCMAELFTQDLDERPEFGAGYDDSFEYGNNSGPTQATPSAPPVLSREQAAEVNRLLGDLTSRGIDFDLPALLRFCQAPSIERIPARMFQQVIDSIRKKGGGR